MRKAQFSPKRGVHVRPKELQEFSPQIDYRTPVLLHQGFGGVAASPGTIASVTNQIATGRGTVKFLDLYPFFTGELLSGENISDQDAPVTISAGGQVLLQDTNLGIWAFDTQLGKDKRHRVRVELNDAQSFTTTLDLRNAATIQALLPHFYYSTPEYEHFLKNVFALQWDLGLKRRTYRLSVPIGGGGTTTAEIENVLPRNNGDIIGIGIHSSSNFLDLRLTNYEVLIDGVKIIENVFGEHASTLNGRDGYLMPVPIRPGATFNFAAAGAVSFASSPIVYYITFYFGRK